MNSNSFELQVLVNGRPVKEHFFQSKTFIEARRGTVFSLKLKNNTHRRAVSTFSIDGVDALTGKMAGDSDGGYIVGDYSSIEIKGFRTSNDTVSEFVFSDRSRSYAKLVGGKTASGGSIKSERNCGVIAARITLEEIRHPLFPFTLNERTSFADNAPENLGGYNTLKRGLNFTSDYSGTSCSSFSVDSPEFKLGTTWGEEIKDSVTMVPFEKSTETFDISIFYDERASLEKIGIDFSTTLKAFSGFPSPFSPTEFCKIPNKR